MLEGSASKHEKTPLKPVRRWLLSLLLILMMGTVGLIYYSPNQQGSWPLYSWTTHTYWGQPEDNTTYGNYIVEYPHIYRFIVDEPDRCSQESPFLVLMIPVEPHNREARDIIRKTWGKESHVLGQVVSHYFLLGSPVEGDTTEPLQEEVFAESQKHGDILQWDFLDSYNNLTIKTMVMFEWLSTHCPNTSYAMKIDSDIFLNVHNLVETLLRAPRRLYMTGLVTRSAFVHRDPNSKWFMPFSVFPEATYPPYVLGLGYVFSLDLSRLVRTAAAHVKAVYIEDVYVGMCLKYLGIELTDPPCCGLFEAPTPVRTNDCHWTSVIATVLDNSRQLLDAWGTYENQIQSGC